MLVLDSSSTCDVCLESYSENKVPHVINCGHTFCLRCLQLLTRQICPLCRRDFEPVHVRRLHTDKGSSRPTSPSPPAAYELDEPSAHARHLQGRISHIVLDGAASVDVLNTLEDVNEWLQGQPPKEHADLEAAYFLLRRYAELQHKCTERKASLINLQEECEDLREQLHLEQDANQDLKGQLCAQEEMAEAKCQELQRLRDNDRQEFKNAEVELREQLTKLDRNWTGRHEVLQNECKRLAEAVRECERNHQNPLPMPPRYDISSRPSPQTSPPQEDMVIVQERADERPEPTNSLKIDMGGRENIFHVSPVAQTQPIPPLTSETFRALSDDIPDSEDEGVRNRSAKAIPIKNGLHRAGSSRLRYEDPMARSLPRSLIDVHMAGCSTSPGMHNLHTAIHERREAQDSRDSGFGLNLTSARYVDCQEMSEEERQVRRRAQLHEVLHDPTVKSIHSRSPAPVIPPPPPPTRSNTVRWASEAAKAAERARTASIHTASSSSYAQASAYAYAPPTSPSVPYAGSTRTPSPTSHASSTRPPSPTRSPVSATRMRPHQVRTTSTDSLKTMKIPASASNLTRTFLVQEAHAQRVS